MAPDLDCSSPTEDMRGYLRKSRKWNKRFYVLREGPPPRLEYYDSEKKFIMKGKPKRVIDLENAWNVDKKVSSKHKYLIGIYTQDEYFAMSADSIATQEMWVDALQKAIQNFKGSNGRCHCMYKHIWQGNVDTKELENCNNDVRIRLQAPHRCCLTEKAMVFIRLNNNGGSDLIRHQPFEIPIVSIRSCGHKDNLFFMEPGRSSGVGTGKFWMELDDAAIADNMHTTIFNFMKSLSLDDGVRQRSYSSGSGSSRTGNRSRHYNNPPPSQVGMGKPPSTTTPTGHVPCLPKHVRTRCESFPATQVAGISDEARYRTSSEGESTMKRPYPFLVLRRKGGSVSPNTRSRVCSHVIRRPLHLPPQINHIRTSSLPGSYTSSSNSSIEHLNVNQDSPANLSNGQSPTMSEGNPSSDEFSSSPHTDLNGHGQLSQYTAVHSSRSTTPPPCSHAPLSFDPGHRSSLQLCFNPLQSLHHPPHVPPPPSIPPQANPLLPPVTPVSSNLQHEYVNVQPVHSRSHSLDDNLSCGTGASSLSTSPQIISGYMASSVTASPDVDYVYSQSPHSSCHSQNGDFHLLLTPTSMSPSVVDVDDYTPMSTGSAETYPHQTISPSEPLSDYTLMNPGKSNMRPIENKSGYVPMRPLVRSSPQDISSNRRRSLTDNRMSNGSYSPVSPLSRSPDKAIHLTRFSVPNLLMNNKRSEISRSYPCTTLTVTASHPSIPLVSCHGLEVDVKNDFSLDSNRPVPTTAVTPLTKSPRSSEFPPTALSDDYAYMGDVNRTMVDLNIKPSIAGTKPIKPGAQQDCRQPSVIEEPTENESHEYVPMSPMNMSSNTRKSVVGLVLSVAESSSPGNNAPQYPHQIGAGKHVAPNYSTNSLDRVSKHSSRKRSTSLALSGLAHRPRHSSKAKPSRKSSLKLHSEIKSTLLAENRDIGQPPLSPGGEYVAINFEKAKRGASSPYITSESSSASGEPKSNPESPCNSNRNPGTPKTLHDSNRNLLPTKQTPPSDDHTFIKPRETIGSSQSPNIPKTCNDKPKVPS